MKRAYNFQDLSGRTFGSWTVISEEEQLHYRTQWLCRCVCGTERIVQGLSLTSGRSTSCGCARGATYSFLGHTDGKTRPPEYSTWIAMRQRCLNPKSTHYARYGGRGITVCERWNNSFLNFIEDMGGKPTPKHTLERIDNHGNYEPGNCRWATRKEQAQNRTYTPPRVKRPRGPDGCYY